MRPCSAAEQCCVRAVSMCYLPQIAYASHLKEQAQPAPIQQWICPLVLCFKYPALGACSSAISAQAHILRSLQGH